MRPRLLAIFLILVLAPLGLLAWLGARLASGEQRLVRERVEQLLLQGLAETRQTLADVIARHQRWILRQTDRAGEDPEALRALVRQAAVLRSVFLLGPDCGRLLPPVDGPQTRSEREFSVRAQAIWPDLVGLCHRSAAGEAREEATDPAGAGGTSAESGWYVWRWGGSDTDLIFWHRTKSGGLVGAELDSIRLLSDLVAALPATGPARQGAAGGRVALTDAGGRVLYQWGDYQPADREPARAELALAPPLDHWKLVQHLPAAAAERAAGSGVVFSLVVMLAMAGLALVGLAVYFYWHQARTLRLAAQRVSFVNRVSHELRTPLTNIRLYAELIETRLTDADEKTRRQLGVIVSESARLSRLIGNVLAFSRQAKDSLAVHPTRGRVDEVVGLVLEHFSAALADRGVRIEFDLQGPDEVLVDSDALEQILGNLLSNVEKYLPSGSRVRIETRREQDATRIRVIDDGPGIPAGLNERIFEPFFRVSDRLTDGVSGTGLGLGIARDLARLHGGDLRLLASERGACFELSLRTPSGEGGSG